MNFFVKMLSCLPINGKRIDIVGSFSHMFFTRNIVRMVGGEVGVCFIINFSTCCKHINKFFGHVAVETIPGHEFFNGFEF